MENNNSCWTESDIKKDQKSESRFLRKKRKALLRSEERRRKNEIKEINKRNRYCNEVLEKIRQKRTTTKLLMYFILLNCSIIEIYSMVVMFQFQDLSALYSLIGAVVGESISYAIYCCKSFNDTKEEKRHNLEREMWEAEQSNVDTDSEEGGEDDDE